MLAPTLWNILYDRIIRQSVQKHPEICVYADDTLIIVGAETPRELKAKVEKCINSVNTELSKIGLKLNLGKTEILTRIQKPLWQRQDSGLEAHSHYQAAGVTIFPKSQIKYLGVQLYTKLLFREHLEYIIDKCKKRIPLLQKLCKNTYGYQYRARKIMFAGYVYSLLIYCSSVFYQRLKLKTYRALIDLSLIHI